MVKSKKFFVNIYAKIFTDSFSDEMVNRYAAGTEVYNFLMKDACQCIDENGDSIPGDSNLWYLGCNEKFGSMVYKDHKLNWSFGEASFDRVEEFITLIYNDGNFTELQYQALMIKLIEGRLIGDLNKIKGYLICKKEGREWHDYDESPETNTKLKYQLLKILNSIKKLDDCCFT